MYFVQYCHACISAAFVLSTKYSNVIKKKIIKKSCNWGIFVHEFMLF